MNPPGGRIERERIPADTIRTFATQGPLPHIAVIGCGAAAQEFCLPVLSQFPGFSEAVVVVDRDPLQAAKVAQRFGIHRTCVDFDNLPGDVDAAIVTTPHHLHAEHAIHFLQQGKPVFVEKPLGMSASEVQRMLAAAGRSGATLMVNNCRRLFPAYRRVQELLRSHSLGAIRHIRIDDGSPFDWNSVSSFYLRVPQLAKGVLLDRGAHTIDLVCWWLNDRPRVVWVRDDALGGAEGLARLELASGSVPVHLTFSRYFKLDNSYTVTCERGTIHGRLFQPARFDIVRDGRRQVMRVGKPAVYQEYARRLVANFVQVVQGRAAPLFLAADVAPSLAVIDEAYARAERLEMPWYDQDPNLALLRARIGVPAAPS